MKNVVQGSSHFQCECHRKMYGCEYSFLEDADWELANEIMPDLRSEYPSRELLIVRNEHVPLKGCVVVQKFERSSIIYYT